jgi:PAS domain S-box-containing protein
METVHSGTGPHEPRHWMRVASVLLLSIAILVLVATLACKIYGGTLSPFLLSVVLVALSSAICLHCRFLILARREHRAAAAALGVTDQRFQQMASNIREIFWMLDAETKRVIYVNKAFEDITGRSISTLDDDPVSYEDLIHPEDRVRVLSRLSETIVRGQFDEEFRIVKSDATTRWVWARGFPVRDSSGAVTSLVGTAQDLSSRKSAEEQIARNLDLAERARAEADAFRKTTLALTQSLSMDYVLDTLLQSLLGLISYESACVLLMEGQTLCFVARQMYSAETKRRPPKYPSTFDARENFFFAQVLLTKRSQLLCDTSAEVNWESFCGHSHFRSWLCVPLIASESVVGLLSLGHTRSHVFGREHLRLAESLAIPGAVAIQNARLYERAEIYSTELEQRLADLEQVQEALKRAERGRIAAEEAFTRVFRRTPIALSITTIDEGRFVDVNEAFERRYGYSRSELIGRTVTDIGIWGDPDERSTFLNRVGESRSISDHLSRLRKRSGDFVETLYSAHTIDFDGRCCVLDFSQPVEDDCVCDPPAEEQPQRE